MACLAFPPSTWITIVEISGKRIKKVAVLLYELRHSSHWVAAIFSIRKLWQWICTWKVIVHKQLTTGNDSFSFPTVTMVFVVYMVWTLVTNIKSTFHCYCLRHPDVRRVQLWWFGKFYSSTILFFINQMSILNHFLMLNITSYLCINIAFC